MTYLLTLKLDDNLQNFFEQQRQRYFPKHLNRIPAHVMLFHQLPAQYLSSIKEDCEIAASMTSVIDISFKKIRFLGKGNAYDLSLTNKLFYDYLKNKWQQWLIPQDLQTWIPHVTIQNKVTPHDAKALYRALIDNAVPFNGTATGITLWYYNKGDWKWIKDDFFTSNSLS
jgi:hypothetical protein